MDIRTYLRIPFRDHGRGFDGCDCWGLAQLVYREELGIELPDLGDAYSTAYARGEVNEVVRATLAEPWNIDVTNGLYQLWDVMIFRRSREETHVGLYFAPGKMLHTLEGAGTCLERYDGVQWARKLTRVIRHRERASASGHQSR